MKILRSKTKAITIVIILMFAFSALVISIPILNVKGLTTVTL
jgi:hypothetical protein